MRLLARKGPTSDQLLLQRLQKGDGDAWNEFLHGVHGTRLYNHLRYRLPEPQDVEDVLNETMLAAVQALQNFDGTVKLSTFLFSLANRKIADFWRRRPATSELTDRVVSIPGMGPESIEFLEMLYRLKDEHRQVLLMRYHIGLGVDEIAHILGKTYRGAESLLSRARSELRDAMGAS
ncbi:MAG: RNA polymerase sigma factor [Caldilineaceae bacterium]